MLNAMSFLWWWPLALADTTRRRRRGAAEPLLAAPPPPSAENENNPPTTTSKHRAAVTPVSAKEADDPFVLLEREIRMLGDEISASKRLIHQYQTRLKIERNKPSAIGGEQQRMVERAYRLSITTAWRTIDENRKKIATLEDRQKKY